MTSLLERVSCRCWSVVEAEVAGSFGEIGLLSARKRRTERRFSESDDDVDEVEVRGDLSALVLAALQL